MSTTNLAVMTGAPVWRFESQDSTAYAHCILPPSLILPWPLMFPCRYRFIVDSSHNDCYALEGALLERRDPYARETEFDSNWCMVPAPLQAFNWTAPTPPTVRHPCGRFRSIGCFGIPRTRTSHC